MRTVTYRLADLQNVVLPLGFVGENQRTRILFDSKKVFDEYPNAIPSLSVAPPEGEAYPAVTERDGNFVIWNILDSDLIHSGTGSLQLSFMQDEAIVKSYMAKTKVLESIVPTGSVPTPIENWLNVANLALGEIPQAIIDALTEAKESGEFKGDPGYTPQKGIDYFDGYTPQKGVDYFDGRDGHTPEISAEKTGKKTIISVDGEPIAEVDDGQDGETPTAPVQDVQVNGTSILENGVADLPIATGNKLGLARFQGQDYGIGITSAGIVYGVPPTDAQIKGGNNPYKPITTSRQEKAVFYGLAKAAGVDMKDSSNPVGQFTSEAIVAIQKMLGVYEAPWKLIREDTVTNATEADIEIAVDGDGNAFELTDIRLIFWTPLQETEASKGDYGRVRFYYSDSSCDYITAGSWTQATSATVPKVGFAEIVQSNGMIAKNGGSPANKGSTSNVVRYGTDIDDGNSPFTIVNEQRTYIKINIRKVTGKMQYRLYGRRKWN